MGDLGKLLNELVDIKAELNHYKKLEKDKVNLVKKQLDAEGISKDIIEGVKVNYVDTVRTSVDEDKLIEILVGLSQTNPEIEKCIRKKLVVDEDVLEKFCYEGIIDPTDLQSAYSEKITKTLKVSKVSAND